MTHRAPAPDLVDALLAGTVLGKEAPDRLHETHLSWVILAGPCAWKIKKPVRFGFVDFTTLESRRLACLEELRLNRRLAPDVYLDVVAIRGTASAPTLAGDAPVIEYAVKMRRFAPDAVIGERPVVDVGEAEIEALARLVAGFHAGAPRAPPASDWGSPARVVAPVRESLDAIGARGDAAPVAGFLLGEAMRLTALIEARRREGAVRECHGDLHLGNLVRLDGRIVPFDALEFDPALRWIDVMNDVAFLAMDLDARDLRAAAFTFLNAWLEVTGEHAGLPLLPFYAAYRALVRAKVSLLAGADGAEKRAARLLAWASAPFHGTAPTVIVLGGVSGSGKSWLARRIAQRFPAIHLRSDVERKRIAGLPALARSRSTPGEGLYASDLTERTYSRLAGLAEHVVAARLPALVDATNLRADDRARFARAARGAGCRVAIVWCHAAFPILRARIGARLASGADPSEADHAILERQLAIAAPPSRDEADLVLGVDTSAAGFDVDRLVERLRQAGETPSPN